MQKKKVERTRETNYQNVRIRLIRVQLLPRAHGTLICVEDLKAKNLLKNHCLAKSIQDAGWRLFCRTTRIQISLVWQGTFEDKPMVSILSSPLCSSCGAHTGKEPLSGREWDCPECGVHHYRDVN